MLLKPPMCGICSLHNKGAGFAYGDGNGKNKVLLLGEALGAREAQLGKPFVGDAGAQLNRTLQRVAYDRQDFRIDNVCRCRPPNNWFEDAPWEEDATANCTYYFHEELDKHEPKAIVPMGNVPLKYLLGDSPGYTLEDRRGYVYRRVIDTPKKSHHVWVVPTYHPSFLMRGAQNLTDVQSIDIRRGLRVARDGYEEPDHHYIEHPTFWDMETFLREAIVDCNSFSWLSADIETPKSGGAAEDDYGKIVDTEILRISFSFKEHHAITVRFCSDNFNFIEKMLMLPWPFVIFWNQEFDVPRLLSKGLTIRGKILDAMYMWHFLQSDLPKKLGYVASLLTELREWKSMSEDYPEYYSCVDADATIQCTLRMRELLTKQNRLEQFLRHYVHLHPKVEELGNTGVLLDMEQQGKFRKEIENELQRLDGEIQDAVPLEVKVFEARKRMPADANIGDKYITVAKSGTWDFDRSTGEFGIRFPFLYGSPKQVISYMRFRDHPVPINYKTGKPTTGAAEIEKLANRYPDDSLYPLILSARGFGKIMGQYIEGYQPDPDGRVRTHFNRKPSTWRFNSERPNVQNVLNRAALAKEYRKQFVAAPGYLLVELDYKAIEAQLVGWYAEDPDYVRAAKLGVHAILMSHVLGRPVSLKLKDRDIKELVGGLKRMDPSLYDACKHVVHGSNYGGTARRMRIEYPELFVNVAAAREMQDTYFRTIATKVRRWQQKTLYIADKQHYLENVYGYRHYFWDVFHYAGRELEWGTDAKRALAFLPQSTAAGIISEALLQLARHLDVFPMLRWTIHDSLVAEIPDDKNLGRYIGVIRKCMEAPQQALGGLSIEVEIAIGKNWGEMEDYKEERGWFA